ncbi:carbohydrate kinase [Actinomadura logoneensis]|uniref:Carbohydrate kinase n=1 Tax=Actinomadura logoneensis TaxID=2293572 RepID=A0A372JAA0_9ACTN|nr:FGGY family carbohydrate kinase [Actinomadura logoneensis]RFU36941.1 carbohydrate kinase [Actinomadura logoneensis]
MTRPSARDEAVWIGVDLGTQSVRALAVTAGGEVRGAGGHPLTGRRDGPRHEQDPEEWWTAVGAACRQALRDVPAAAVRAVAVDGTSGTILLTDATGRPLTPGLMYDDTRAADQVERINRAGAGVWARLGYRRMQPAWALPRLLWLLEHRRDLFADGVRLAHQTDFVNARLTGGPVATDLSSALKTGADLVAEDWPRDVLADLGVPDGVLPALERSGTPLGTVSASAAEHTGLPAGVPVIAGCTDGCASQLGTGRLTVGSWNSVLGTTLVLKGVTDDLLQDPLGVVYSHRAPDGHWLPGGASSTGAGALTRDFPGRDLAALDRAAAAYEPSDAVAYPLVAAGERFPFVAADAHGFVLGEPRDDAERFAAVLQGVGYVERLCFDYLAMLGAPVDGDLTLTGGAARSAYWCQLRADILGRPVTLPEHAEPALGAAVLAASAGRDLADVAAGMVSVRATVDPRPTHHTRFDDGYLRLVGELERRGWLPRPVAEHARERTPA